MSQTSLESQTTSAGTIQIADIPVLEFDESKLVYHQLSQTDTFEEGKGKPFHVDGTRHVVSSPSVSGYRQSLRNSPRPQHSPPTPIHGILPAMRISSGLWPVHLAILIVSLLVLLTRCQLAPKPFPASDKGDFSTMQTNPLARIIVVPNSSTVNIRQPKHWFIGRNLS